MLFPLSKLLEGRESPLCVAPSQTLREALALMIEHDYSQLPVKDPSGHLMGLITEAAIVRKHFHLDGYDKLLDMTVDHFMDRPVTMSAEEDLFDALDRLKSTPSIVVVADRQPIGILTDYDTTVFFRNLSEGLILVQDIELTLRQHIETVFSDSEAMNTALIKAVGALKSDPSKPRKAFEDFTFGNTLYFIIHDDIWQQFEAAFTPKEVFFKLIDSARELRNQLAHFRGGLAPVQRDRLLTALQWLTTRPSLKPADTIDAEPVELTPEDFVAPRSGGKYDGLQLFLSRQTGQTDGLQLSLQQIEDLIGGVLPDSARQHRSWWSNDPARHSQALAWLQAGWRVEEIDLTRELVTFQYTNTAASKLFLTDVLTRLRSRRANLATSRRIQPNIELVFGLGQSGYYVRNTFGREGLRVELYIDMEDYDRNKAAFDALIAQRAEIEREIGETLEWRRIESRRACRIFVARGITLNDPPEVLETGKEWSVTTILRFVDTFRPLIKKLNSVSTDAAQETADTPED